MSEMLDELIAPCGMNCRLCVAYQRKNGRCPGCRPGPGRLSYKLCKIKNCDGMKESALGFCYNCAEYPCRRLVKLDNRYSAKYHTSLLGNLEYIRENGLDEFLRSEEERWTCKKCGGVLSIHREECPSCRAPHEVVSEEASAGI
jgi:hypothetical protein